MPNRYATWTPRLLKAAYNYQFVTTDPGAYTHNPTYAMQVLYDSLESLSRRCVDDGRPGHLGGVGLSGLMELSVQAHDLPMDSSVRLAFRESSDFAWPGAVGLW